MSCSNTTRVLEALNILCNASEESLRPHGTKLKAIVQKLQSLTKDHGTTITTVSCHNTLPPAINGRGRPPTSLISHRSPPIPHTSDSSLLSLGREVEKFVSGLNKELVKIKKLLSQVCHKSIIGDPVWMKDDPRVVDLQIAGNHNISPTLKLRRGLSQRSLAFEFDDWERTTHGTSRVTERTTEPSVELRNRKLGHIAEFLKINKDRFHNQKAVRAGIEHGIKLLVCETLLGETGFSAILSFHYTSLRSVPFKELDCLKDAIQDGDPIKELAEQQTEWLDLYQRDYDAWYKSIPNPNRIATIKRRHLSIPSTRKRVETRRPDQSDQVVASLTFETEVEVSVSRGRNTETIPANVPTITPILPAEQTHSLRYAKSGKSAALRFPSVQNLMRSTSSPNLEGSGSSTEYGGMNTDSTGQFASSDVSETRQWTGPFESRSRAMVGDISMVLNPSCHTQQGNPSYGISHKQTGDKSFDPSAYISNPSFGDQGQMINTFFDPSSYIQVNPSVDIVRQEEIAARSFDPSSFVQEKSFTDALCNEQVVASSSRYSSYTQPASSSFELPCQEQMGNSSFDPSNWI